MKTLYLLLLLVLPIGGRGEYIKVYDSVQVVDTSCGEWVNDATVTNYDRMVYISHPCTTYTEIERKVEWPIKYWFEGQPMPDLVDVNDFIIVTEPDIKQLMEKELDDWWKWCERHSPAPDTVIVCDTTWETSTCLRSTPSLEYLYLDTCTIPVVKCDTTWRKP